MGNVWECRKDESVGNEKGRVAMWSGANRR